jgi:ribonuclease HI
VLGETQTNNRGELGAILEAYKTVVEKLGTATQEVDILI